VIEWSIRDKVQVRKNVVLVFLGNAFSKALGAVREMLLAGIYGTGVETAGFRVAVTGTLVPVNLLIGEALNAAFVPVYLRLRSQSESRAQTLLWLLVIAFLIVSLILSVGIVLTARAWAGLLAPGLNGSGLEIAIGLLQVMALGIPCYLFSALLMFLAMANDDFAPMTVRQPLQNAGFIAGIGCAFILGDARFLGWGFTLSYVVYLAWVAGRTLRAGWLRWPRTILVPELSDVGYAFWRTFRPLLLLPILIQSSIVIERIVASMIGVEALSAVDYARFINETVIFLVSVPVAFAGIVRWSSLEERQLTEHLQRMMIRMLIIAVPVAAFVLVHAQTIVSVFYARGAFDQSSVAVTGSIMTGAAYGLWAQTLGYVLIKALNARMRNSAAIAIMAAALFMHAMTNILLYRQFGASVLGYGYAIFGIVMFVGGATILRLWGALLRPLVIALGGVVPYFILSRYVPIVSNDYFLILVALTGAVVYWLIWLLSFADFRKAIPLNVFSSKSRFS